ncbi:MAG: hypothetical protein P8Y29_01965 [Gemmatimonadota bacterium]|jgi:hypothetical protein
MQATTDGPLAELAQRFTDFIPTLTAGLFVLLLGIGLGWLAKRATVRILIWLRLDRLSGYVGWRAAFGKGDVRAQLYELVGSVVMAIVILTLLDQAVEIWGLTVLSELIESIVEYLPRMALAVLILGVGSVLVSTVAQRVQNTLEREQTPRPRLLAGILKASLLAVTIALSLWQLNFAREIVFAAFLIGFGAIGVAFAMAVGLGSAKAIQSGLETLFNKQKDT